MKNQSLILKLLVIAEVVMAISSCTIIDDYLQNLDSDIKEDAVNSGNQNNSDENPQDEPEDSENESDDSQFIFKNINMNGTVSVSASFSAKASSSARLYVALPLPESNLYQEISLENTGGAIDTTRMGNKFIYWDKTYSSGDNVNLNCEYQIEYETYSVRVDLTKIKEIYPYDTESDVYKQNIGSSGDYIVPTHPDIISIASSLWDDSKDILDYAKNCYEYTAANYQYLNPNTGLHKLDKNLQNGGGDCGNLSAIYISLLRNRNIPARPVVCIRPDGSFHVWSEFYLESYGWIPVDVTYKNSDREGNYFGVYSGDCIVVSNEYYVQMTAGDRVFQTPLLQTYAYWYWNMSSMRHSYSIEE